MQSYAALQEGGEQEESGVLIHVVESSRARWNHIEDLDSFFSRMYRYHQRHGFYCMMVQEVLQLVQFVFVIAFSVVLACAVNYPVLFGNKNKLDTKVTIPEVFYSWSEIRENMGGFTWFAIFTSAIILLLRLFRGIYYMFYYWDIKQFYNSALNIEDQDLENLTWHEVQTKIRAVQLEQQMCIHKRELSELDIYHRILRQQNYFIAMANKRLLPPRLKVPLIGDVVYWTRGLRYNMQLLLFWGPWAPFQNPWHLREEYRKPNLRHELAHKLAKHILWLALANLLLSPLVLIWQILYAFFSYAEIIRREPGSMAIRNWSLYGRLYLRHFNELDHELHSRLNRAHVPATRYLSSFSSPMGAVLASSAVFMLGSVLIVLAFLSFIDEDVLRVEHVLGIIALLSGCVPAFRSLIPDETLAYCPETLLSNILTQTHYLPPGWRNQAHTTRVRKEIRQLFQYKIVGLIEELLSPIITPYILWRHVYPRSLDIVDFFRNFTVSVVGVGDVCSFAQLDIRKHGNPEWQGTLDHTAQDQYTQAEDGKVEISLLHFTRTNPGWRLPPEAEEFVQNLQRESSMAPQSSGDFMLKANLNDSSTVGIPIRMEGPSNTDLNSMNTSTLFLHDRHFRQVGNRYQRPVEETTPLLSSH